MATKKTAQILFENTQRHAVTLYSGSPGQQEVLERILDTKTGKTKMLPSEEGDDDMSYSFHYFRKWLKRDLAAV